MQKRIISSSLTFLQKFIIPTIWIVVFGNGTVFMWLGSLHGKNVTYPPNPVIWLFTVVFILGTCVFWLLSFGLKKLAIDDQYLYISNYFKEISVPFHDIKNVTEIVWINIHPTTIYFNNPTAFGNKITFMPKARFSMWASHPIVAELKKLAGLN